MEQEEPDDYDLFIEQAEATVRMFESGRDVSQLVEDLLLQAPTIDENLAPSPSCDARVLAEACAVLMRPSPTPVMSQISDDGCSRTPVRRRRSKKMVLDRFDEDIESTSDEAPRRRKSFPTTPTIAHVVRCEGHRSPRRQDFLFLFLFAVLIVVAIYYFTRPSECPRPVW